jgi:hypothetical protein
MFPLGVGAAYRSWEIIQSIPLDTMNATPDLCCYKYRPACSDERSISVESILLMSDFQACIPVLSLEILQTSTW